MSWDDFHRERATDLERLTIISPRLRRTQLPDDVQALLDDPARPQVVTRAEAYPTARFVMDHCEAGRHAFRGGSTNDSGRWVQTPKEVLDENVRWQSAQLRLIGIEPGTVVPIGGGYGYSFGEASYVDAVYFTVLNILFAEADAHEASLRQDTKNVEDLSQLADVPTDGEGVGYDFFENLLSASRRTAQRHVDEWVDRGLLRIGTAHSERGGKPRKLFWRIDPDVGASEDPE